MKVSVVTTTINSPDFLGKYLENFYDFNVNPENVVFIVVGDNKTPKVWEKKSFVEFIEYWSPRSQDKWLHHVFPKRFQKITKLLTPENDMRRRNFGYLRAIELNSDYVITVDDDNYPLNNACWLTGHINNLKHVHENVKSINNIVNPCSFLQLNHSRVYSRGYPISNYFSNVQSLDPEKNRFPVLNVGLWTRKPDVDSFTNIGYPDLNSKGQFNDRSYSLTKNNYFPVDTQNTAFKKKLSIFHNVFMDPALFHRFDDVWMGLFAQKLMHKMGDTASFGKPVVEHRRNAHNYVKDFHTEFMGIGLNSKLWKTIMSMNVESKTYNDGFLEIAARLPQTFKNVPLLRKFFDKMRYSMELWVELIETL